MCGRGKEPTEGDIAAVQHFAIELAVMATRKIDADGKHRCPYKPCERRVNRAYFACRAHWMKVPKELREALYDAVAHGTNQHYLDVACDAYVAMNAR